MDRNYNYEDAAATRLQRLARDHSSKKKIQAQNNRQNDAGRSIQKLARGRSGRKKAQVQRTEKKKREIAIQKSQARRRSSDTPNESALPAQTPNRPFRNSGSPRRNQRKVLPGNGSDQPPRGSEERGNWKRFKIHAHDDDDTKAYKARQSYLANKGEREEQQANDLEEGEARAGGGDDVPTRTNPEDDFCVLSCLGFSLILYYGFCVFLWIAVHPIFAVMLGVGAPVMLWWLLRAFKQAKKEGKRAMFLW